MATILDVERESGVSKSTISRFLNGKNVTESNRLKIIAAIDKLGYQINPIASSLKTNRTNTIGILLPDVTDTFFPPIIKSFEEYLTQKGYSVILCNYQQDVKLEKQRLQFLAGKRVDGIIVASSSRTGEHIQTLLDNKVPVLLLDRQIPNLECDAVIVDNEEATYRATKVAIQKGHSKIAFFRGPDYEYTAVERYKGYVRAMTESGLDIPDEYVVQGDFVRYSCKNKFIDLMRIANPPTLVMAGNIYIAIGVLEGIVESGMEIPEDVSVISFDDYTQVPVLKFMNFILPKFTCIKQPIEALGRRAAELILHRIEGDWEEAFVPEVVQLRTSFELTDSVKDLRK